jgi:hypothetical protein
MLKFRAMIGVLNMDKHAVARMLGDPATEYNCQFDEDASVFSPFMALTYQLLLSRLIFPQFSSNCFIRLRFSYPVSRGDRVELCLGLDRSGGSV